MNLTEQIAALEAKAHVVDEIRKLLGAVGEDRARFVEVLDERDATRTQLNAAKARIASLEEEVENLVKARDADAAKEGDARAVVSACVRSLNVPATMIAKEVERLVTRPDQNANRLRIEEFEHDIGAAASDLRSAAQRLGERFEGNPETLSIVGLASGVDEAVAGLLEDYECAKAEPKPQRGKPGEMERSLKAIKAIADDAHAVLVEAGLVEVLGGEDGNSVETKVHNLRAFIRRRFAATSSPETTSEKPVTDGSVAAAPVETGAAPLGVEADPIVIMRTIPSGRQLYSERDGRFVPTTEMGLVTKYADVLDAEAIKRAKNLRKSKVCRLSEALAPRAPKANPPRVVVLAEPGDEGAFIVCTNTDDKRAWLTTSQGLHAEGGASFTETQHVADEQGDPIAEFELLDEAKAAAADLAKAMPNAGTVTIVEVHDVGRVVNAEEKREAAE